MHPCKSFTDDLGGETYLDSGGKNPAENLPIIQYVKLQDQWNGPYFFS